MKEGDGDPGWHCEWVQLNQVDQLKRPSAPAVEDHTREHEFPESWEQRPANGDSDDLSAAHPLTPVPQGHHPALRAKCSSSPAAVLEGEGMVWQNQRE